MTYQVSVAVLMQAADLYCPRVGEAAVAPADNTVVVPGVTAEIVHSPAPMLRTVITVPIGCATDAFVGILKALADALFIVTSTWYESFKTVV
jgi:hypothetical protein